jgi:hypothetical protein
MMLLMMMMMMRLDETTGGGGHRPGRAVTTSASRVPAPAGIKVVGRPTLFPVLQPLDGREDRQRRGVDDHGYCGTAHADAQSGAVDRVEPAAAP